MPTYEYECKSCSHRFEKFQSITSRPLRKCPECTGSVRRLIGAGAGVIFKGSGFYETDYRSSEYKQKAKADKENGSSSPEGSSKSSDAKESSSGADSSKKSSSKPDSSSKSASA